MTYNAAIPQSTDLISNSQPQILANFSQLNTQYLADHDGFNTGSGNGSGMHDQVTFLANQAAPSLTRNGVAGVSGLYANTDGSNSQLFFQNAAGSLQVTGKSQSAQTGYTMLPGGFLLQWGISGNINSQTAFPLSFPAAFYSVTITGADASYSGGFVATATSQTGFTARRTDGHSGSTGFFYIAIGK